MVIISASIHLGQMQTVSLTFREQGRVPGRSKLLPEIVYGTKEFEYTHTWNLLGIETDVRFVLSYQEWFPYPELTLLNSMDAALHIAEEEGIILAFEPERANVINTAVRGACAPRCNAVAASQGDYGSCQPDCIGE